MGANTSSLLSEEIEEIARESNLSARDIKSLYKRFEKLDRSKTGMLSVSVCECFFFFFFFFLLFASCGVGVVRRGKGTKAIVCVISGYIGRRLDDDTRVSNESSRTESYSIAQRRKF